MASGVPCCVPLALRSSVTADGDRHTPTSCVTVRPSASLRSSVTRTATATGSGDAALALDLGVAILGRSGGRPPPDAALGHAGAAGVAILGPRKATATRLRFLGGLEVVEVAILGRHERRPPRATGQNTSRPSARQLQSSGARESDRHAAVTPFVGTVLDVAILGHPGDGCHTRLRPSWPVATPGCDPRAPRTATATAMISSFMRGTILLGSSIAQRATATGRIVAVVNGLAVAMPGRSGGRPPPD